jgi:hypothetical protein
VKDFTLNAYKRAAAAQEANEHWYGLNLCWSIIQARQGLSDADVSSSQTTGVASATQSHTDGSPTTASSNGTSSNGNSKEVKSSRADDRFPHPDVTAAAMTTFLQLLGTEYALSQRGRYMNK